MKRLIAIVVALVCPLTAHATPGTDVVSRITNLEQQVAELQGTVGTQQASIAALQTTVESQQSAIAALEAKSAGAPVAWAMVSMDGYLSDGFNITADNVIAPEGYPGVVCFHDLPFTVRAMGASPSTVYGAPDGNRTTVSVGPNRIPEGCLQFYPDFDHTAYITAYYETTYNGGPGPFRYDVFVWFW